MTGHRDKLINFVSKFIRMVRFDKDHFAAIMGYGDLQMGNILISCVYYIERLGHNLFSVRQFCDSDLEVAFRKHTCYVQNLEGVDLLSGSRGSNIYTISMADIMKCSPICLLSKASKTKSWLWHHRLSHLNFGTINKLAKQEDVGITHHTSTARTLQQNSIFKRHNRMLVEAARTMLIFFKSPLFLWAEVVATACYTQNRSLIHTGYNKTPYELLRDRKPKLKYLQVFCALCYPTNNFEDLRKLQPKIDIGIFIHYSPSKKAYQIYNKRTRQIMETMNVQFDELTQIAFEQHGSGTDLLGFTSGHISSDSVPYLADFNIKAKCSSNQKDSAGASSSTTIDQEAPSPTKEEPKNYKEAMEESCWIESMQEEIHKFERLEV
ncbi:integrase, catalytic region, zinc finger, CCHC-type containing protein [Tanacetum coccineum]